MKLRFSELSINQTQELLNEAVESNAFLPYKDEANQTIKELIDKFSEIDGFRLFGFINAENEACSFIVILEHHNSIDIGPMYVRKNLRGMKLGQAQVKEIIRLYKDNVEEICTQTWGENYVSQKIFTNLGFALCNRVENTRVNGDCTLKYKLSRQ